MSTSPKAFAALKANLWDFMKSEIYPNEARFHAECEAIARASNEWHHPPILCELMQKARRRGLWNLFLPTDSRRIAEVSGSVPGMRTGLTNRQYAELCEIMGTSIHAEFAANATNCTSPDTGNMEVLARYGTAEQKRRWLVPLLRGQIRSCYAMTEPTIASSDATNVRIRIDRDEARREFVINGRKWWCTGAGSVHCELMILMGKTDPNAARHRQQSQILVPMRTPGITLLRPLRAFGDIDSPKGHMEVLFENVRVPFQNVVLGEGRGFEIAQGRLGPGRIHHCMRAIGQAERAIALMCGRVQERRAFGKPLSKLETILQTIAKSRADIESARLLVYRAAELMDSRGNRDAKTRQLLSLVKAHVPSTVQRVADRCIQAFGAMGVSQDTPLVSIFLGARLLRIADGPDEVHWRTAGRIELKLQKQSPLAATRPPNFQPVEELRRNHFRVTSEPLSAKTKATVAAIVSKL